MAHLTTPSFAAPSPPPRGWREIRAFLTRTLPHNSGYLALKKQKLVQAVARTHGHLLGAREQWMWDAFAGCDRWRRPPRGSWCRRCEHAASDALHPGWGGARDRPGAGRRTRPPRRLCCFRVGVDRHAHYTADAVRYDGDAGGHHDDGGWLWTLHPPKRNGCASRRWHRLSVPRSGSDRWPHPGCCSRSTGCPFHKHTVDGKKNNVCGGRTLLLLHGASLLIRLIGVSSIQQAAGPAITHGRERSVCGVRLWVASGSASASTGALLY